MISFHTFRTIKDFFKQRNGLLDLMKLGKHIFLIGLEAIFYSLFAQIFYCNTSRSLDELLNLNYISHEIFELCFVYFLLVIYFVFFVFMSF